MDNKGTITWFDMEVKMPPVVRFGLYKRSNLVLAWGPGGWAQITFYNYDENKWENLEELPWTPTHWAYINYP